MAIVFVYFLFDTAAGLFYSFNDGMMLIHHITVLAVFIYCFSVDRFY